MKEMPAILFVCTGNLYRSPLAAAFLRAMLSADGKSDWVVDSAGTWTQPGQSPPNEVIQAATRYLVNLDGHLSKIVSADLLSRFDLILVMERGHKEAIDQEFPWVAQRTHLLSQVADRLDYDITDPARSAQKFSVIASDLYLLVDKGYPLICELAQNTSASRH